MPFAFGEITTPGGRRCLLIETFDRIELADARALEAKVVPGAPFHGGVVLTRAAKASEYSTEARKFFPSLAHQYRGMAAVVSSPIVRAAINLMVRLSPADNRNFRMFRSEAEALAWLDERASEADG